LRLSRSRNWDVFAPLRFVTPVPRRRLILDVLRFAPDYIKEAAFEDSAATLQSGKAKGRRKARGRQEESRGRRKEAKRVWVKI